MFKAKEGSAEASPVLFGVESVLWSTTAAKHTGKCHRGTVKGVVDGFMARWHKVDVENSWLRHANEDAKKKGGQEKGRGAGSGTGTGVDYCREDLADRDAKHKRDGTCAVCLLSPSLNLT